MRNRKQLLADFYLSLLSMPFGLWRARNQILYAEVREALAIELDSDPETVQSIFERMVQEDEI